MISTKFYAGHDERFYLEDWAKEGNMSEDKLKQMELEFLTAIVSLYKMLPAQQNLYINSYIFSDTHLCRTGIYTYRMSTSLRS